MEDVITISQSDPIVTLSLHPERFDHKPSPDDAKRIRLDIPYCSGDPSFSEFMYAVERGQSYSPAVFVDSRSTNDTWHGQRLFAIDIDNVDGSVLSMPGALDACRAYEIEPAFIYPTFSHTPEHPKFRIGWLLPAPINDPTLHQQIALSLIELFNSDKSAKDRARFFYGTCYPVFHANPEAIVPHGEIIRAAEAFVASTSSKPHMARAIKRFHDKLHITVAAFRTPPEGEETGESMPTSIINIGLGTDSPILSSKERRRRGIEIPDDDLIAGCQVIREMDAGQYHHRQVRYGVGLNLLAIRGGESFFLDLMIRSACNDYQIEKAKLDLKDAKSRSYLPARCDIYCPHEGTSCLSSGNIIRTCKLARTGFQIKRKVEYRSLEEVSALYVKLLQEVLSSEDRDIHVIRVDTGVGKTEALLNLDGVVIACPTHKLKAEVVERARNRGITLSATPEIPASISSDLREQIESLYRMGCYSSASAWLSSYAKDNDDIREYFRRNDALRTTRESIVTTHARLVHVAGQVKHSTIIFDEDPLTSLIPIGQVLAKDVAQLYAVTGEYRDTFKYIADRALNAAENVVIDGMPAHLGPRREIERLVASLGLSSNLYGFLEANHFIRSKDRILFTNRIELPGHKKVIVLSATASEPLWRTLYGDRVHFYDLPRVELRGQLVQLLGNFSREKIRQKPELVRIAKKLAEDRNVITFKELVQELNAVTHFGALEGIDAFAGKDLLVVGTPHVNPLVYLLYAARMGVAHTTYADMRYMPVEDDCFRFWMMSYAEGPDILRVSLH